MAVSFGKIEKSAAAGGQAARGETGRIIGGAQGQQTEIAIMAEQILKTRERLNRILAENCGQPFETVQADTERDRWLTAEEAVAYGIVDRITASRGAAAASTPESE